ncbi:MAG: DUF4012 domain-containing protein [Chloroflexota bacterium]|nr:DUF4012 domain-containing protein [Chloroflexota bacterium]
MENEHISTIETSPLRPPTGIGQTHGTEGQPPQGRGKKWRPNKRQVVIAILLFLLLAGSISSVVGYLLYNTYNARYHSDLSQAQTGVQHLQKAEALLSTWSQKSLDPQAPGQAKNEFAAALKIFTGLQGDVQAIPGIAAQAPVYGTRVSAAQHLLPLAITAAQAGIAGSDMLNTLAIGLHDPLTPQGRGITQADLNVVSRDMNTLNSSLALAARQVNQLQPADIQFDPRIARLVSSFHKNLPLLQQGLTSARQLLSIAPTLLGVGTPTNYLIEILDSTELRPGGGFIGNYGVATLAGGRLASAHITDTDLLDGPFVAAGHSIPYPPSYTWFTLVPSWNLRNSNLDADFPTAARYAEQNYTKEGGNTAVQGVIAVTPVLIERVLTITGPIAVPEYHETVTAQNLIARIHFHQLGGSAAGEGSDLIPSPDGHSSLRKRFTELLAEHLLDHIRHLPASGLSRILQAMMTGVSSKDMQLYFNSPTAENVLHGLQLDAAIQAPAGDSLFVVDANIGDNKANSFITNTLDDQVSIDAEGNAIHHASIRYAWTTPGPIYGNPQYQDFIHVYAPPTSVLLSQNGWQARGTSTAFHREVWMGYFTLNYGQTSTITLVWKVAAAARKDASGWHYQYTVQRQAGILRELNLQVALPTNANITSKSGGLTPNATLKQALTKDLNVGVSYVYQ